MLHPEKERATRANAPPTGVFSHATPPAMLAQRTLGYAVLIIMGALPPTTFVSVAFQPGQVECDSRMRCSSPHCHFCL